MGPHGIISSLVVVFASFYFYSSIFPDQESFEEDQQDKSNMNVAKNIAANVIKLAPSGPVSLFLSLEPLPKISSKKCIQSRY